MSKKCVLASATVCDTSVWLVQLAEELDLNPASVNLRILY
jgi:hypothetical protein